MPLYTEPDCSLDGEALEVELLEKLSSSEIARIVGTQQPGDKLEYASDCTWKFTVLPLACLKNSCEDLSYPDGGWAEMYLRFLRNDENAIKSGSPEYKGRDAWIREKWLKDTRIYPLYLAKQGEAFRLLDGYRRLAGAFYYNTVAIAAFVGNPKIK